MKALVLYIRYTFEKDRRDKARLEEFRAKIRFNLFVKYENNYITFQNKLERIHPLKTCLFYAKYKGLIWGPVENKSRDIYKIH